MTASAVPANPKIARPPIAASNPTQSQSPIFPSFDDLPDGAYVRQAQLVRSPKRPDQPAPLPFSAPTLWRNVKAGTFPHPVKLSSRVTAWRVGDVRAWMAAHATA